MGCQRCTRPTCPCGPAEAARTPPRAALCTPPLRGSVVCSELQYQNFKKTGTGRRGGPGQGTQRQDDSGRSWHREYQVHLISSQEGLGLSGWCWCQRSNAARPLPRWPLLPGSWAVWAPCRLGHRKLHSPGPGADPALRPLLAAGGSSPGVLARQGSLVAHARSTGTMICALLGGGGGGVLGGGSMLWPGPGASKVHQVRHRGGSGSIDRGVLSVLWFQGDRECLHQVGPRDFPAWG